MEKFSVLLLFFLFLFTSCSFPKTSSGGMTDVSAEYLTNLYTEIACELPDTARINHEVLPYYDSEAGTVTEFLLERKIPNSRCTTF